MPEETIIEYRIVGDDPEDGQISVGKINPDRTMSADPDFAWLRQRPGTVNVRVQSRTITTSAWADMGADECPFTFAHTREWCGFAGCREA